MNRYNLELLASFCEAAQKRASTRTSRVGSDQRHRLLRRRNWFLRINRRAVESPPHRPYTLAGGEKGPVTLPAFKAGDPALRGSGGGFDSHTLPPNGLSNLVYYPAGLIEAEREGGLRPGGFPSACVWRTLPSPSASYIGGHKSAELSFLLRGSSSKMDSRSDVKNCYAIGASEAT